MLWLGGDRPRDHTPPSDGGAARVRSRCGSGALRSPQPVGGGRWGGGGGCDGGEASGREVWEETGLSGEIVSLLDRIEYFFRANDKLIRKEVDFYLMRYTGGEMRRKLVFQDRDHAARFLVFWRTERHRYRMPEGVPASA